MCRIRFGLLAVIVVGAMLLGMFLGSLRPGISWAEEKNQVGRYQVSAFVDPKEGWHYIVVIDTTTGKVMRHSVITDARSCKPVI